MSRLEMLRRLTWFFDGLWSIECGTKPLAGRQKSGLSSSIAERFHYSGLNCLFDFRIWEFEGDILWHMPMECQKVVKLSERPNTGLSDMY